MEGQIERGNSSQGPINVTKIEDPQRIARQVVDPKKQLDPNEKSIN
jgi:hypothetical protein